MRLTGDVLGRAGRGGPRTTVRQHVRFFADTEELTEIRWYGVPADRPTLPYPSFVANESWHNENGPFSGMDFGFPPSHQGVQFGQLKYESVDPKGVFNPLHVCGSRDQWGGAMRTGRPADLGRAGCCNPLPPVGVHISPKSVWVKGSPACVFCGPTPTPAHWWVVVDAADWPPMQGTWEVAQVDPQFAPCAYQGVFGSLPPRLVLLSVNASDLVVTFINFGIAASYSTPTPYRCDTPLTLPLSFGPTFGPTPPPRVQAYPFDPGGRRSFAFAGKCDGHLNHGFTGDASVRIQPRSAWTASRPFAGRSALAITPFSVWSQPSDFAFAGTAGQVITPASSFVRHGPTDCTYCSAGIQENITFPPDAWTGTFSPLAGGFTLPYVSPCTFQAVLGGVTVTVSVTTAGTLTVDDGAGNLAVYSTPSVFNCEGANTWNWGGNTDGPVMTTSTPS